MKYGKASNGITFDGRAGAVNSSIRARAAASNAAQFKNAIIHRFFFYVCEQRCDKKIYPRL